jgi:sugar phosphate isomerase/epimerase
VIGTIGLSTGIDYRHPIEGALGPIRERGFRRIEVSTAPSHLDLRDGARIGRIAGQIRELDLEVVSLHAPFGHDLDVTSPDAAQRERSLETMVRAADALVAFGGTLFVIHPGGEDHDWVWERDARMAESARSLGRLWHACRARGLTLVLETTLPHLLGGQPEQLAWLLERLPTEGTGVCLDTSHTALGRCLFEIVDSFAARLVHLQASDNHGVTDDHLPPGEGRLDWAMIVDRLERALYPGTFLLEIAGGDDLRSSLDRTVAGVRRMLDPSFGS